MTTDNAGLEHIDALEISLSHTPVEPNLQGEESHPTTTGATKLGELANARIGVWEMSVGCTNDIEVDEYFVVLSGYGSVQVAERNGFFEQTQQLAPGSVVRLYAGMHTIWQVKQTLRKVYMTATVD